MANVEGSLRMKRLGRLLMVGGALAALVACLAILTIALVPHFTGSYGTTLFGMMLAYLGFLPMTGGLVVWCCGWIVEGFILPAAKSSESAQRGGGMVD